MPAPNHVDPHAAARLIEQGAVLVDIREADERARMFVPGSRHAPLSTLGASGPGVDAPAVIFHCRSGGRTGANATRLLGTAQAPAYLLAGGIEAWKGAGLPVQADKGQPIEIMRQVQITAGSLVVAGVALGTLVAPGFYAISAFVGAGLVFAGVTGWCGMARVLATMPWNRRVTG